MTLNEVITFAGGRPCEFRDDRFWIMHENGANSVSIDPDGIDQEVIKSAIVALDMGAYPERHGRMLAAMVGS
jgi:hypothetical protein